MEPKEPGGSNFREEYDDEDPRLTDLVVVAHARHSTEAAFLCSVLEEAEIPAAVSGGNMADLYGGIGAVSSSIIVPRDLADQARQVLARAKEEAEKRSIDQAFEEHEAERTPFSPQSPPPQPGTEAYDQLVQRLKAMLVEWIAEGYRPGEVAQRLAGAGLRREEADQLMIEALGDPQVIERAKTRRLAAAVVALVAGMVLWFLGIGKGLILVMLGMVLGAWGLSTSAPNWHVQSPAAPSPPKEDDAPQA